MHGYPLGLLTIGGRLRFRRIRPRKRNPSPSGLLYCAAGCRRRAFPVFYLQDQRNFVPGCNISTKKGVFSLVTQSDLLTVLALAAIALVAAMAFAIWKLLRTIEKLSSRVDDSLQEFETTGEGVRENNA